MAVEWYCVEEVPLPNNHRALSVPSPLPMAVVPSIEMVLWLVNESSKWQSRMSNDVSNKASGNRVPAKALMVKLHEGLSTKARLQKYVMLLLVGTTMVRFVLKMVSERLLYQE